MREQDRVREGDYVRWQKSIELWVVEEIEGDCAWIMGHDGNEEWVRVCDLQRVTLQ